MSFERGVPGDSRTIKVIDALSKTSFIILQKVWC